MAISFPDPHIIDFPSIGKPAEGYISVGEAEKKIPFKVERVFWTYFTPENIVRGRHAHYKTEQLLIAAAGRIVVTTEMPDKSIQTYVLDRPDKGVYIPPHAWHTMQYSHSAVQLVFASTCYDEKDYIRNYEDFIKHYRP